MEKSKFESFAVLECMITRVMFLHHKKYIYLQNFTAENVEIKTKNIPFNVQHNRSTSFGKRGIIPFEIGQLKIFIMQ